MSDIKETCADLVNKKMWSRSADLEELNDIIDDNDSDPEKVQEALEELNNLALEITTYKVVKILMSTGGPADWIEVKVDDDGDIIGMSYHYADWFDHAETSIENNSYLWDYAEQIVNGN